jgi:ferredoxin
MRIVLDESKCSSLGMCEAVAPDLFEVGDDGALHLLVVEPPDDRRADVEEAIAACPTGALSLAE